ncbi:hypothetical protein [Leptothoe sp. PORK10 BA2]|uniref:hypothetical protein n=1 Tax=Leptothoe sp. PORK10 BA2 TaxID=3110254 RepID=UPI002B210D1E|nr:hypothetical protein [Leptothoe sp. PORK10 BA2]MEA5463725.1 hypothetical protein [Leptothoe sp. PORK10 BA2]
MATAKAEVIERLMVQGFGEENAQKNGQHQPIKNSAYDGTTFLAFAVRVDEFFFPTVFGYTLCCFAF